MVNSKVLMGLDTSAERKKFIQLLEEYLVWEQGKPFLSPPVQIRTAEEIKAIPHFYDTPYFLCFP